MLIWETKWFLLMTNQGCKKNWIKQYNFYKHTHTCPWRPSRDPWDPCCTTFHIVVAQRWRASGCTDRWTCLEFDSSRRTWSHRRQSFDRRRVTRWTDCSSHGPSCSDPVERAPCTIYRYIWHVRFMVSRLQKNTRYFFWSKTNIHTFLVRIVSMMDESSELVFSVRAFNSRLWFFSYSNTFIFRFRALFLCFCVCRVVAFCGSFRFGERPTKKTNQK